MGYLVDAGAIRCRTSLGAPNVSESMSSDDMAYANPSFTNYAHCASASHGA